MSDGSIDGVLQDLNALALKKGYNMQDPYEQKEIKNSKVSKSLENRRMNINQRSSENYLKVLSRGKIADSLGDLESIEPDSLNTTRL